MLPPVDSVRVRVPKVRFVDSDVGDAPGPSMGRWVRRRTGTCMLVALGSVGPAGHCGTASGASKQLEAPQVAA